MEFLKSFQEGTIGSPLFCAWIGALIGHILSLYDSNFKGTKGFLQGIIPNHSETFYKRLDFILLPVIGTLLAFILISPGDPKTGIFSGLSWSGTLLALLKHSPQDKQI